MGKISNIGEHRVRHGNIYDTDEIIKLVGNAKASLYYSDPPWGAGNIRYWNTINKRQNDTVEEQDEGNFNVVKFVSQVLTLAQRFTKGWVVIEYGQRWSDDVIKMAEEKGLYFCAKSYTMYRSGSKWLPVDMLVFNTEGKKEVDLTGWTKIKNEEAIISWIINRLDIPEGSMIMDLCAGMGNTARVAIRHNCKFIGNELNEARLNKTIISLEKSLCK